MADPDNASLAQILAAQFGDFRVYLDERIARLERSMESLAHKDDVANVQTEVARLEREMAEVEAKAERADRLAGQMESLFQILKWLLGAGVTGGGSVGLYELLRNATTIPTP